MSNYNEEDLSFFDKKPKVTSSSEEDLSYYDKSNEEDKSTNDLSFFDKEKSPEIHPNKFYLINSPSGYGKQTIKGKDLLSEHPELADTAVEQVVSERPKDSFWMGPKMLAKASLSMGETLLDTAKLITPDAVRENIPDALTPDFDTTADMLGIQEDSTEESVGEFLGLVGSFYTPAGLAPRGVAISQKAFKLLSPAAQAKVLDYLGRTNKHVADVLKRTGEGAAGSFYVTDGSNPGILDGPLGITTESREEGDTITNRLKTVVPEQLAFTGASYLGEGVGEVLSRSSRDRLKQQMDFSEQQYSDLVDEMKILKTTNPDKEEFKVAFDNLKTKINNLETDSEIKALKLLQESDGDLTTIGTRIPEDIFQNTADIASSQLSRIPFVGKHLDQSTLLTKRNQEISENLNNQFIKKLEERDIDVTIRDDFYSDLARFVEQDITEKEVIKSLKTQLELPTKNFKENLSAAQTQKDELSKILKDKEEELQLIKAEDEVFKNLGGKSTDAQSIKVKNLEKQIDDIINRRGAYSKPKITSMTQEKDLASFDYLEEMYVKAKTLNQLKSLVNESETSRQIQKWSNVSNYVVPLLVGSQIYYNPEATATFAGLSMLTRAGANKFAKERLRAPLSKTSNSDFTPVPKKKGIFGKAVSPITDNVTAKDAITLAARKENEYQGDKVREIKGKIAKLENEIADKSKLTMTEYMEKKEMLDFLKSQLKETEEVNNVK